MTAARWRRALLGGLLALVAAAALAGTAEAQDKKKKGEEQQAPPPDPAAIAAAQAQAQAELAAKQAAEEKARVLAFCRQLDETKVPTVESASGRVDCYKQMQLAGQGDAEVDARYAAAVADLDQARKAEAQRRQSDSSAAAMNQKMEAVRQAIEARDLDDADNSVDDVLAIQPNNARALAYKDRIAALKRVRQLKIMLVAIAVAVIALGAGLAVVGKFLLARRQARLAERKAALEKRKAVLKVVDGIGRGKIFPVENPIFRIGATSSAKAEENNDLVLSDADAVVSRYHCSILRKDGEYYLIDSSVNGTFLNDALLKRGEHHRLEDGDEVTVADVSRLKFLFT